MILLACFLLLALLFVLPFLPGIREFIKKEDASPLYINMNYSKDPRFFARSFKSKIQEVLRTAGDHTGIHEVMLSKPESLVIENNVLVAAGSRKRNLHYIKERLSTEAHAAFEQEVYVCGETIIGADNEIRALACEASVRILPRTKILRWLDAEGDVEVAEACDLGISVTSARKLRVAPRCTFRRLYGFPISTGEPGEDNFPSWDLQADEKQVDCTMIERGVRSVEPGSSKDGSIISDKSLTIGEQSRIMGHVKAHGTLRIGAGAIVRGNVFAEKDIILGPGCRVFGTVFTQGKVTCERNAVVGMEGKVKSVVAKKGIELQQGVNIYGFISTEGEGIVL